MLDRDPVGDVFGREQAIAEFLEHFGQAFVKVQFRAQLFQLGIGRPIHPERVEQHFHVGELVVVTVFAHQIGAAAPEFRAVDSKRGKTTSSCM